MLTQVRSRWNFRMAVMRAARTDVAQPPGERDVVVLPCWRRPEFLWHCLDNLSQADGILDLQVIVRLDTGYLQDNLDVIRSFSERIPHLQIQYPQPCPFRRTKQSANVLLGYLQAAAVARRFVFLVEEDIMVARDFFRWHRAVHAQQPRLFCSIAARNPNRDVAVPHEVGGYYRSTSDYCSLGVCLDRRIITGLIAAHVNMQYFGKPKRYLRRHFPASAVSLGFVEQDGLIRRIQEKSQLPLAYPCMPRAFHAGFYGYNRPGGIDGSLQERIRILAGTIYDRDAMRCAAGRPEFIDSCRPCDLHTPDWHVLRQIHLPADETPVLAEPLAAVP
ncbi:MAG: hypothetical protein ACRETK_12180 [Steroidobacteraceae bacterium]